MRYTDEWGNVYESLGATIPLGVYGQVLPQGGGQDVTNALTVNPTATGLLELASLHATLLVGDNLIATGTGDDKRKQDPTYVVQRPWVEPPEGSLPFDPQTSIMLPVAAGNNVVVAHVVPDGYDGVIKAYSWNFTGGGFVQGSGDLVVQLLRNGVPIRNYDNITVEKGSIQQARTISPIRIFSKQIVTLVINHVSNALLNGNVIGSLVGYDYPAMS